jgi:putative ABC transport system substrate-binding protein
MKSVFAWRSWLVLTLLLCVGAWWYATVRARIEKPLIAIVNYGPHPTLDQSIEGVLKGLDASGLQSGRDYVIEQWHGSFDRTLIPTILQQALSKNPQALVTLTTPVTLMAKQLSTVPVFFLAVTDPDDTSITQPDSRTAKEAPILGLSDRQDMNEVVAFILKLWPNAKRIGMLYAPSEPNDVALLRMARKAVQHHAEQHPGLSLVFVGVDHPRDIPLRVQSMEGKVDVLYVGTSGPIQPSLPAIASEARRIGIPIVNAGPEAVSEGLAVASFGVTYQAIGEKMGRHIATFIRANQSNQATESDASLAVMGANHPSPSDHRGTVSRSAAERYHAVVPDDDPRIDVIE